MAAKPEYFLQVSLANRMKSQYPDIPFRSDLGGIRLTIGQAKMVKAIQWGRAWPDFHIPEPRIKPLGIPYYGMYLELKDENTVIFKKDGTLVADKHIREQAKILELLRGKRYYAEFAVGFEDAWKQIETYLSWIIPL